MKGRLDPDPANEDTSFFGVVELLKIVDETGETAYDAWLYRGDSGSIFRAGTTEIVAEIIQVGLECKDPGLRDGLRTALQERTA